MKAMIQVQRAHEKIRNQRLDFARKTVVQLFNQYDQVSYEDLKIDTMVSGNFAKSIHDAGWGVFIHALQCKAEYAGKWAVAVNPKNTTATCSGCGKIVKKSLWERIHTCEDCGLTLKRDHNAAIVIDALGRSAVLGTTSPQQKP
jgi:putative transposase